MYFVNYFYASVTDAAPKCPDAELAAPSCPISLHVVVGLVRTRHTRVGDDRVAVVTLSIYITACRPAFIRLRLHHFDLLLRPV